MQSTLQRLKEEYAVWQNKNLSINMERGWPCDEQLKLSMPMLSCVDETTELCREVDYRGYAGTGGILPLKQLFSEVLGVSMEELYIGGTMSTTLMYDIVNKAVLFGLAGHTPWKDLPEVKFLCPVPGYEKHFKICDTFGIKMIPVAMKADGPDMDEVETLVRNDPSVKGIWCVPLYSNPTGAIYSDDVVRRLAEMKTAAEDFRIFWDNAYCVHHLTDKKNTVKNIIRACEKSGNKNRVFEFASTSKITFPGGGVAICASSKENIDWLTAGSLLQLKSGDKINQLRHTLFLRDVPGLEAHMKKHRAIIWPKFEKIDSILNEELRPMQLAQWTCPQGGYFINVALRPGMADKVWRLCKEAGVRVTPAGSTFPYGKDPDDRYIRLAPTYPSLEELEQAMRVFCLAAKIVYLEGTADETDN